MTAEAERRGPPQEPFEGALFRADSWREELLDAVWNGAKAVLAARGDGTEVPDVKTDHNRFDRTRSGATVRRVTSPIGKWAPPPAQEYGVSYEGAKEWVARWMRFLGADGSAVTRYSADGGIEVESEAAIAQVKHYSGAVGVREIREFAGVLAHSQGRSGLYFTSGRYAPAALEFGDLAGVALFTYDVATGTITPVNGAARDIFAFGIEEPPKGLLHG